MWLFSEFKDTITYFFCNMFFVGEKADLCRNFLNLPEYCVQVHRNITLLLFNAAQPERRLSSTYQVARK